LPCGAQDYLNPSGGRFVGLKLNFDLVFRLPVKNAFDGLPNSYAGLKIGFDRYQFQRLRPGFKKMIDTPKQGMQAMNDLPPKQETPGMDGIHVQRIIVSGEFRKSELIVR
jgi:hypothetical protein